MTPIIPSILEPTQERFLERYNIVSKFCPVVQLDVLDGTYLPTSSFRDPAFIAALSPAVAFEIHFMTEQAGRQLAAWNFPWVKKIIFHIEAEPEPAALIARIRSMDKVPAVAKSPQTDPEKILPLLKDLHDVLVMTVEPGRNAAPFVPETVEHVRALHAAAPSAEIEVDGGINPATGSVCKAAGAKLFVVGSYLRNDIFEERLRTLEQTLR